MYKLFGLVMILLILGFGAPHVLATEWKTFYSPEKKFSIDYALSESVPLNITETQDQITIRTGPLDIRVGIVEPPLYQHPIQQSIHLQNFVQSQGNTVTETTHPITINGKEGYSFTDMYTVEDFDGTILDDHIFMRHDDKNYIISLQYDISHIVMAHDEIIHTMNSIKFFD